MADNTSNSVLVGIDFGTTKTCLAWCLPGSRDVKISEQVPTFVAIPPRDDKWLFGVNAQEYSRPPGSYVAEKFKMEIAKLDRVYKEWRNADIAGRFLAELRQDFVKDGTRDIKSLTITVPAEWSIDARWATLYAARLAGFDCPIALLEEPLAAFLRIYNQEELKKYQTVLVFDFGGGTCDISLIDLKSGKPRVARSKTVKVGGGKIDEAIVRYWFESASPPLPYEINRKKLPANIMSKLDFQAEGIKKYLSDLVRTELEHGHKPKLCEITSPYEEFKIEDLDTILDLTTSAKDLRDLIVSSNKKCKNDTDSRPGKGPSMMSASQEGIMHPIRKALEELLGIKDGADDTVSVDCVILSGGSFRLWVVQDFIKSFFEDNYGQIDFLPEKENLASVGESVGRGAALHQFYADQGNPVAVPSLNYSVTVTIKRNGKVVQDIKFDSGTDLPTHWKDVLRKWRWYISMFARRKKFEIIVKYIDQDDKPQRVVEPIPTEGIPPVGELAWVCSINEYGLVQLSMRIIDIASLRRLKHPFYLYPAQKEFTLDEEKLDELRTSLGI